MVAAMTNAEHDSGATTARPPAETMLSRSAETGEWIASRYADVQAILADDRFEVPAVHDAGAAPGSIAWLRASVSRFANGSEHEQRRAEAISQLSLLSPDDLRAAASEAATAELRRAGLPGDRFDVMARLARHVPMAVLAGRLDAADPGQAAEAVIAVAAGYFGAPDEQIRKAADAGTARLISLLEPADLAVKVAKMTLLVQGCDAIAGLIGTALHLLADRAGAPDEPGDADGAGGAVSMSRAAGWPAETVLAAEWPAEAVLREVLRYSPPVRAIRRVARIPTEYGGSRLPGGSVLVCDVESANRDPAVFDAPDQFDPARSGPPSLTFGWGVRPCPGHAEALMLAVGVVDAVREHCSLLPGQPVEYLPGSPLRIPQRLDVLLA